VCLASGYRGGEGEGAWGGFYRVVWPGTDGVRNAGGGGNHL